MGIIDEYDLTNTFPSIDGNTSLERHSKDIVNHIDDIFSTYATNPTAEMYSRGLISTVWLKAALLANQALLNNSLAGAAPFDKITVEYDTTSEREACTRSLEFAMRVKYTILNLLVAKTPTIPMGSAVFQVLAQMVAVRDKRQ